MGWLSDKLFGKKKRINQNKINDYMAPYGKMIDEQEDISRQMMDPNSLLNLNLQSRLRRDNYDMANFQNRNIASQGAMGGLSQGQVAAQQAANFNQSRGTFGRQMEDMLQGQYNQGLMGLQNVMSMRQGEGERLSNMHIQQVNAANARRQANMGFATSLLGMGLDYKVGMNK